MDLADLMLLQLLLLLLLINLSNVSGFWSKHAWEETSRFSDDIVSSILNSFCRYPMKYLVYVVVETFIYSYL